MAEPSPGHLQAFDALQQRYLRALDDCDMSAWLATFAEAPEASYICISAENERAGHRIALMLDDCHARLQDRVTIVTRVWAGTFQPYRTRHFAQRVLAEREDDGTLRIESNFTVQMTPEGEPSRLLAIGCYHDRVRVDGAEARFVRRRAVYDTNVLPRYIVYPL